LRLEEPQQCDISSEAHSVDSVLMCVVVPALFWYSCNHTNPI